jgi:hypothetical protein
MSNPNVTTPTTPSLTTQKVDVVAEFQALIDGIGTLLAGIDPFLVLNRSIPRSEVLATLQARIDAAGKTKAERKLLAADVAAEKDAAVAANAMRKALKAFCVARFGATSPILQQLGFVQNRKPKVKPANKAAGATKATKTRAVRGTKGKQPRAAASAAAAPAAPANGATPIAPPAVTPAALPAS